MPLTQYNPLFIDWFLGFSLLQWLTGLVITGIVSGIVGKWVKHRLEQRSNRHEARRQWYRDIQSVATRINKRFGDEYWEPPEDPELEDIGQELQPLIRELEELIGDPPDHTGADSTIHFAEKLRKACVRLEKDPEHIKTRRYGFKPHMAGATIVSNHAERLQFKANIEIQKL